MIRWVMGLVGIGMACSASGQAELDVSARALGFNSFQHYQQARSACFNIMAQYPLVSGGVNCGTDMACIQREGAAMQARMRTMTQSPAWISNKCDVVAQVEAGGRRKSGGGGRESYVIEVSHDDELFIINGERYEAQTYCFNMEEGDEVIFIEGDAFGGCATATIINLRTRDECELWCE